MANVNEDLKEKLVVAISLAKDRVETDAPKDEKDKQVSNFFNLANQFSENGFRDTLKSIGFNDYEVRKMIDFKNQSHINDITLLFFKEIDFASLNVDEYQSPLSKNKNWLLHTTIEKEQLSSEYSNLVEYISIYFKARKAEFLSILDRYIAVSKNNLEKQSILEAFQNSDPSNKTTIGLLTKELNQFASRYSINDKGSVSKIKEKIFSINGNGNICFVGGKTRQTDCVFDDVDGSKGLICATSDKSTENQQQLYKFRTGLSKYFNANVNCYIYCDSLVNHQEKQENKVVGGRPPKISELDIRRLNKDAINSINLIGALQVFMVSDLDDTDYYKDTLEKTRAQFFNNDGGAIISNMSAKEKISLLEKSVEKSFSLISENNTYWLITIAKDLQKKFLLNLCNAFIWLHTNDLFTNPKIIDDAKKAMSNYTLPIEVDLSSRERQVITTTKKMLGLDIKKLSFE